MSAPGRAKEVARNVCGTTGHNLVSLQINPVVTPATSGHPVGNIPQFELRCSKCTLTPDSLYDLRDRDQPQRKSKSKTPTETAEAGGE